jgi:ribosomal protein S19
MMIVKLNKNILFDDVGLQFKVYNGKVWQSFLVVEDMVSHTVGEFVITKKLGSNIHRIKKKQKNRNKKK